MVLTGQQRYNRSINALERRVQKIEQEGGKLPKRVYNLLNNEYTPARLKSAQGYTVTKLRQIAKYDVGGKTVNYEQLKNMRRHKKERERKEERKRAKQALNSNIYIDAIYRGLDKIKESFSIGTFKQPIYKRLLNIFQSSIKTAQKEGETKDFLRYLQNNFNAIQADIEGISGHVYMSEGGENDDDLRFEYFVKDLIIHLGVADGWDEENAELETADLMDNLYD